MIVNYMSWEGGVDLVACTREGLMMPNVIIHVARMVHTPAGSAPAGMVLYQPDPSADPKFYCFVSESAAVGAYFGPCIFAGTPFEKAPVIPAKVEVWSDYPRAVGAKVMIDGCVLETRLVGLGDLEVINRPASFMPPFVQQGLEAAAPRAELVVDGRPVPLIVPPIGISGGPAAVWAPAGMYAR